ncbi:MAG TPA: hypothetical protein ENG91_02505 [Desulfobacteraceae bacterium]|nr:hypothetical protein [Desulfobacteraceae bacterium]HDL98407.1 hypothetical protein [Desulfobacteraceae bacterium]
MVVIAKPIDRSRESTIFFLADFMQTWLMQSCRTAGVSWVKKQISSCPEVSLSVMELSLEMSATLIGVNP